MKFKNLPIKYKLLTSLGLVLGLILSVVAYAFLSIAQLNTLTRQQHTNVEASDSAYRLNITVLNFIVSLKDYSTKPDLDTLASLESHRSDTYIISSELRQQLTSDESVNALDKFDSLMPFRVELADSLIRAVQAEDDQEIIRDLLLERSSADKLARAELRNIVANENAQLDSAVDKTFKKRNEIIRNVSITVVFVTIVILIISIKLGKSMSSPLKTLVKASEKISNGSYQTRVDVDSTDEIGRLSDAFNDMASDIQKYSIELEASKDDLTNQKKVLQTLLEQLPVGVFLASYPDGKPLMVNKAEVKLLGRGIDPKSKKSEYSEIYNICKLDGTIYPNEELPLYLTLTTGKGTSKDDLIIKRPGKTNVNVRVITNPIKDKNGKISSVVALTEDITERKKVEYMKDEFISLASHQLRTPATAVKQYLGLVLEGYAKNAKEEKEYITTAYRANDDQIEIVDDILNVAKLEAGKLDVKTELSDIVKIANSVKLQLDNQAAVKAQKLTLKLPTKKVLVNLDPIKIKMCINNLVSNAIKYTQEKGEIELSIHESSTAVEIKVKDNGIGISKKDQKKLFSKFGRISNDYTINVQGTGLGLYLVKQIVLLHKGKVSIVSAEGKGTCFIIKLPKEV